MRSDPTFDPTHNRGTLPKNWHRCSACGTTTKHLDSQGRCTDASWCAQRQRADEVCSSCSQALPHAAACGATIDPELVGGAP